MGGLGGSDSIRNMPTPWRIIYLNYIANFARPIIRLFPTLPYYFIGYGLWALGHVTYRTRHDPAPGPYA